MSYQDLLSPCPHLTRFFSTATVALPVNRPNRNNQMMNSQNQFNLQMSSSFIQDCVFKKETSMTFSSRGTQFVPSGHL